MQSIRENVIFLSSKLLEISPKSFYHGIIPGKLSSDNLYTVSVKVLMVSIARCGVVLRASNSSFQSEVYTERVS